MKPLVKNIAIVAGIGVGGFAAYKIIKGISRTKQQVENLGTQTQKTVETTQKTIESVGTQAQKTLESTQKLIDQVHETIALPGEIVESVTQKISDVTQPLFASEPELPKQEIQRTPDTNKTLAVFVKLRPSLSQLLQDNISVYLSHFLDNPTNSINQIAAITGLDKATVKTIIESNMA